MAKQPGKSLLVERMKSGEMPPGEKKVPADQIAVIEKWIEGGAAPTLRDEPVAALPPGLGITADERAYWFYQPLKRLAAPAVANPKYPVSNPIDVFVLAKLREKGLDFNPEADRATLIRRATFDLTGLPPTQKEIDAFQKDEAPDAYEKVLDRLLASPQYGERWGRHWLDAAGYADSDGDGTTDTARPYAWRYRDYVIRSLNADKPLDRFVIEQVAGDELVPRPWANLKPEQIELLAATGFLRAAPDGTTTGATDAEQVMTDTIKVVTSSLLGSSVGCAQCHDHRYDPVSQRDYYQLRAVFEPALDPGKWRKPGERLVSLYTDADRTKAAAVEAEAGKMQAEFNQKQTAAVRVAFEKELEKFPEADRAQLKAAFDTPDAKENSRTEETRRRQPEVEHHARRTLPVQPEGCGRTEGRLAGAVQMERADAPAGGVRRGRDRSARPCAGHEALLPRRRAPAKGTGPRARRHDDRCPGRSAVRDRFQERTRGNHRPPARVGQTRH